MRLKGLMKIDKLALIGAIILGTVLSAEENKRVAELEKLPCISTAKKLCPVDEAAIAVANAKVLQARLIESDKKLTTQAQAQQHINQAAQDRQKAEQEYQAAISRVLKPLGLEGCEVTLDAKIGICPQKEAPGVAAKTAK